MLERFGMKKDAMREQAVKEQTNESSSNREELLEKENSQFFGMPQIQKLFSNEPKAKSPEAKPNVPALDMGLLT